MVVDVLDLWDDQRGIGKWKRLLVLLPHGARQREPWGWEVAWPVEVTGD